MLVAEGSKINDVQVYGNIEGVLSEEIGKATGYKVRADTIGFLQRGAATNSQDNEMATFFGNAAAELVRNEKFGYMVALRNGAVSSVPLEIVTRGINRVDTHALYDTKRLSAKSAGIGIMMY